MSGLQVLLLLGLRDQARSDDKKKKEKKDRRIVWQCDGVQLSSSTTQITPFVVDRSIVLACQFGKGRKGKHHKCESNSESSDHGYSRKKKRFLIQTSKKVGCAAKLYMRYISSYEKYNLLMTAGRSAKQIQMDQLAANLATGTVEVTKKIMVKLPLSDAHTNHSVTKESAFANTMHSLLRSKIKEHVMMGITSVPYIKRVLKSFVENEMTKNVKPSNNDRSYFSTNRDIRNVVHAALVKGQYSGLDQENLAQKVEEWKQQRPCDHFYYRKCSGDEVIITSAKSFSNTKVFVYEDDEVDEDEFKEQEEENVAACKNNTLLWVHQSEDQQKLLNKYGELVLIDATYKTTKYALPLFLLVVRTNVSYVPVAEFIIESENTNNIKEALEVVKSWNEAWKPRYFMLDYSEQEYQALQHSFPDSSKYLCNFHVEQAWLRWSKQKEKNNLTEQERDQLLNALRKTAKATTMQEYYNALEELKNLGIYQNNKKVRTYLDTRWLNIPERWCRAFENEGFHVSVTTNNGVEALNNSLKSFYTKLTSTGTLSSLIEIIVNDFIPDLIRTYVCLNYQYTNQYRKYNECIPAFLHNKPRNVVKHCLLRYASAADYKDSDVKCISDGTFKARSQSQSTLYHTVDLGTEERATRCSCQDFMSSFLPCKHLFAIFHTSDHSWEDLSSLYRRSPYLTLDDQFLTEEALSLKSPASDAPELPSDFKLEFPTEEEMMDIPDVQLDNEITKNRKELRNNLKVLDDLTFLSKSPKALQEVNQQISHLIKLLRDTVDEVGNLPVHRGKTSQLMIERKCRQLPSRRKRKANKKKLVQLKMTERHLNVQSMMDISCRDINEKRKEIGTTLLQYEVYLNDCCPCCGLSVNHAAEQVKCDSCHRTFHCKSYCVGDILCVLSSSCPKFICKHCHMT